MFFLEIADLLKKILAETDQGWELPFLPSQFLVAIKISLFMFIVLRISDRFKNRFKTNEEIPDKILLKTSHDGAASPFCVEFS